MKKILFILIVISSSLFRGHARDFVHPGLMHKISDLERMKHGIEAKLDPWYASYTWLAWDSYSRYTYEVRGDSSWTVVGRENPAIHKREYEDDAVAAYQNALMWYFTGDQRHADKTIEILNTWNNLKNVNGIPLNAGLYGAPLINAAEIIRHTNAGWKEEDIKKFEDMLVYPGYSSTTVPSNVSSDLGTFYWRTYMGDPGRAGNQDIAANMTLMAIGVFLDNDTIYDRALRYVRGQKHRPYDLAYASGPSVRTEQYISCEFTDVYRSTRMNTIEDYGYDGVLTNYIYDNGQCQESSRDQGHSMLGIFLMTQIAEMAWNQGDDLYSWADNRLLLGLEYTLKYNVSYEHSYPDQLTPWEPLPPNDFYQIPSRTDRRYAKKINPHIDCNTERISRGGSVTRPYWELPLSHYTYRTKVDDEKMTWLTRARDVAITETGGYEVRSSSLMDTPGWGALKFRRPPYCAGDPCDTFIQGKPVFHLQTLPGSMKAVNFDYYPLDAGGGEGFTYHDLNTGEETSTYRPEDSVQIGASELAGLYLTKLEPGEWYAYTVFIPSTGLYELSAKYAVANENVKLAVSFDGEDQNGDVLVPFGEGYSTGVNHWSTFSIAQNLELRKGVQNLRVKIAGSGNSLNLSDLILKKGQVITADTLDIVSFQAGDFTFNASSSSGLPVEIISSDTSVATIVGNLVHLKKPGTTDIIVRQSGNEEWGQAPDLVQTMEVRTNVGLENPLIQEVKLYPNPGYGDFILELNQDISNLVNISVYDMLGNEIITRTECRRINHVDLKSFPSGMYLFSVKVGTNEVLSRSVLKW